MYQCSANKYANVTTKKCELCNETCETCKGYGPAACLSCTGDYYLQGNQCLKVCLDQYYATVSSGQQVCDICMLHGNCFHCSAESVCTKCSGLFYLFEDECLADCDENGAGTTNLYETNFNNSCVPCPSKCEKCYEEHQTMTIKCTACAPDFHLLNLECLATCPVTYFNDTANKLCAPCSDYGCLTCINSTYCLACPKGKYLRQDNMCDVQCSCSDTSICKENVYPDTTFSKCLNCDLKCKTCFGPSQYNCLTCTSDYSYNPLTVSCEASCTGQTFSSEDIYGNKFCESCDNSCLTCNGTKDHCLSCAGLYFHYNLTFECVLNCTKIDPNLFNYKPNNTCIRCHDNCATCFGASNTQCYSCKGTNAYYAPTLTCDKTCPSSQYIADYVSHLCEKCTDGCATCSLETDNCTKCENGFFLQESSGKLVCLATCPDKWYTNSTLGSC